MSQGLFEPPVDVPELLRQTGRTTAGLLAAADNLDRSLSGIIRTLPGSDSVAEGILIGACQGLSHAPETWRRLAHRIEKLSAPLRDADPVGTDSVRLARRLLVLCQSAAEQIRTQVRQTRRLHELVQNLRSDAELSSSA